MEAEYAAREWATMRKGHGAKRSLTKNFQFFVRQDTAHPHMWKNAQYMGIKSAARIWKLRVARRTKLVI